MKVEALKLIPEPKEQKKKAPGRTTLLKENIEPTPGKLSLTLEDGMIVIRMPLSSDPPKSSSGKSKLYSSTRGPKRVMQRVDGKLEAVMLDGGYLKAIASAFVTLPAEKQEQEKA